MSSAMIPLVATLIALWFAALLLGVEPNMQVLAHSDAAVGGEALEKGSLIRSLFIAGGALILSAVGRLATLGYPEWLPIGELAGILVIFYGVYGRMTSNNKGGTATHGNDGRQADH
jgi:hypothetical protein